MRNKRKLTGEASEVLAEAEELLTEGLEVYFFAISAVPGTRSIIVMGEPIERPIPSALLWL